jgi:hypothetical protein
MSGTCPFCNSLITSLRVNPVDATEISGQTWKSAIFTCPICSKIIGAAFDQTVHTNFIIAEIKKWIGK